MNLLVTGSIGIDTVTTPHGKAEEVLGGSAVYFSFAARHFVNVRLVGVVGEDFPDEFRNALNKSNIDLDGLETRAGSKTFRWTGQYVGDMNEAETTGLHLNVLAEAGPKVPESFVDSTLNAIGPIEVEGPTYAALVKFAADSEGEDDRSRIVRMLRLTVATPEYQFA